ncbi:hypothetical protein ACUWCL_28995, partial [Klebsiella pneumoniae]|uniref:hypothetical protein n=1 Tax=Klebsiella pneumoniae TaxID=573 RepID=UPI0040556972
ADLIINRPTTSKEDRCVIVNRLLNRWLLQVLYMFRVPVEFVISRLVCQKLICQVLALFQQSRLKIFQAYGGTLQIN